MIIDGEEIFVMTLIMAAGKGVRMNSEKSKLLQKIYDKEIIRRVADTAINFGSDEVVTVVGHMKEQIEFVLGDSVRYAYQDEPLGTGHAVMQAKNFLEGKKGKVVILYGDVPLIRKETIMALVTQSIKEKEQATLLTAIYDNPSGYGRIIRDEDGNVKAIVEEDEASTFEKEIREINSGIYCFDIEELLASLNELKPVHAEGEYFLTDVIGIMKNKGLKIGTAIVEDNTEILGVNDRSQLELLTRVLRMKINAEHMRRGVTIEDSNTTYIYDDVVIGKDTVIRPNTTIKNRVVIGANCEIGPNAYVREDCAIGNNVKVGNFVELKNVRVGDRTKIPHFIYMGDTEIGEDCNVGCGTITCNYDGVRKNMTTIGDRAFIGSNVNLVAPVTLGDDVLIAAGSTITEDVPSNHMGIARERQVNKPRKDK